MLDKAKKTVFLSTNSQRIPKSINKDINKHKKNKERA